MNPPPLNPHEGGAGKPDLPVPRIGMDEFLAAQRDPKVHQAIEAALNEGERMERERESNKH
jgi:hypothetical protein